MKKILDFFRSKPTAFDALILAGFSFLITLQPFFLEGRINIFEVGLYLPGINAILHGLIPFKDAFHLRGPFELFIPAFLMKIVGVHVGVLSAYFYFGTVLTLIMGVFIGRELFFTRAGLYLMVPVFVARTFPRVVFTYWGGMRYAFGLMTIYFVIKFFKERRALWLVLAGIFTACGAFTSVEIGFVILIGVLGALIFACFQEQKIMRSWQMLLWYFSGLAFVALPFIYYLITTQSFYPFLDAIYTTVTRMQAVVDVRVDTACPNNILEALGAMINPLSQNFRHMTPCYLYLFVMIYLFDKLRRRKLDPIDLGMLCLGLYGITMYVTAFRLIWASQFEMALQPEKILLFLVLERSYFYFKDHGQDIVHFLQEKFHGNTQVIKKIFTYGLTVILSVVVLQSIIYSALRFSKRFFVGRYVTAILSGRNIELIKPLEGRPHKILTIPRFEGMTVPMDQAFELETISEFFSRNTNPADVVMMYPELGAYSFLIDRPFVGRFPMPTFSWFNEKWHAEFLEAFKRTLPRYIVLPNAHEDRWIKAYFGNSANRQKYEDLMSIVRERYRLRAKTPNSFIIELRQKNAS